jgi:hypothetical protein
MNMVSNLEGSITVPPAEDIRKMYLPSMRPSYAPYDVVKGDWNKFVPSQPSRFYLKYAKIGGT